MEKDRNDIHAHLEKALDAMERPTELTSEEIKETLTDEECLQACRDLMDAGFYLRKEDAWKTIDIQAELKRFKAKQHAARKRRMLILWTSVLGAAMVAGILFLLPFKFISPEMQEPIPVFVADQHPQQITLETEGGKKMVLTPANEEKATVATSKISKQGLDYSAGGKSFAATGETLQTHTLTVPRGENFKVVLCDGTEVWLNANSRLVYPTAFVEKERTVFLEGEAYFKVTKDAKHPFVVKTSHLQTRVLGTEFNIRSYSPTDSHVVLIQGKVEVSNTKGGAYASLTLGEDAHLQPDGNFIMTEVDLDSYIYWKDGYFYFDDVSLLDIMQSIGRWYNINVEFRNKEAMKYKMHFVAERTADLEHTLSLLNRMKKVTVTLSGNTLTVD